LRLLDLGFSIKDSALRSGVNYESARAIIRKAKQGYEATRLRQNPTKKVKAAQNLPEAPKTPKPQKSKKILKKKTQSPMDLQKTKIASIKPTLGFGDHQRVLLHFDREADHLLRVLHGAGDLTSQA
jgi:hypothetical protein